MIIDLGGSIVAPPEGINTSFLADFRKFILNFLLEGKKFIVVSGGGAIARDYQNAASRIIQLSYEDTDWLGIHATRLNAHLLRAIFFDVAHPVVLDDPTKEIEDENKYNLFIASGWRPGWSTDYVAVMLAKRFGVKEVIVATKIPYVYDEDIEKNGNAHPLKQVSWADYRKMVGDKWVPGLRSPVDPIAAKLAEGEGMKAIVVLGTDLDNLGKVIRGEEFKGSVIR